MGESFSAKGLRLSGVPCVPRWEQAPPTADEVLERVGRLLRPLQIRFRLSAEDGEDVAQEVLLIWLRNGRESSPQNLDAWLSKLAHNRCIDLLRRKGRAERLLRGLIQAAKSENGWREHRDRPEHKALLQELRDDFDALQPHQAALLRSLYLEGKTVVEACEAAGIARSSYTRAHRRALAALKRQLISP